MFVLKPLVFRKLNHSSEMPNDALMHRQGLKSQPGPLRRADIEPTMAQYLVFAGFAWIRHGMPPSSTTVITTGRGVIGNVKRLYQMPF